MVKIYTRQGDGGKTKLANGTTVEKSHNAIEMCGALDELNSYIGVVLAAHYDFDSHATLLTVQKDLFQLGKAVQMEDGLEDLDDRVLYLERQINFFDSKTGHLEGFILPNGTRGAAELHYARAICRRVERQVVKCFLMKLSVPLCKYLNRLGDLLFVLARYLNHDKERKVE